MANIELEIEQNISYFIQNNDNYNLISAIDNVCSIVIPRLCKECDDIYTQSILLENEKSGIELYSNKIKIFEDYASLVKEQCVHYEKYNLYFVETLNILKSKLDELKKRDKKG